MHPINKWGGTTDANFVLYYFGTWSGATPQLRFYANRGGVWGSVSGSYQNPPLGEWTHVAWTYNSVTGGQLYINGNTQGSKTGSGILTTNNVALDIESAVTNATITTD